MGACIANLIVVYPAFLVMSHSPVAAIVAQILLGQIEAVYISDLGNVLRTVPPSIRSNGFNLGYNVGSIIAGGSAPYLATWLMSTTGEPTSPAWMIFVASLISLAVTLSLTETSVRPLRIE